MVLKSDFTLKYKLSVLICFAAFSEAPCQSVNRTSFENDLIEFVILYDSLSVLDPMSAPLTADEEIYVLKRFKTLTGINTDRSQQRRVKLQEKNEIQTNGFFNTGIKEAWHASVEISYSSEKMRYHYSLQSRQSYLLDSSFSNTYNKFDLPIRTRSALSYVSYELTQEVKVGIGRFPMNWSMPGSKGLLLSDNVWPQDGMFLRHNGDLLKFEFFTGKLNDLKSRDIRNSADEAFIAKRYISMHRIMLKVIPKRLVVSMSEAIIYGGEDAHVLPRYLNPVNLYFISKQSDRWLDTEQASNPILGIDLLYLLPELRSKFYAQLVIDDIDFIPELTAVYPNRYAYSYSAIHSIKKNVVLDFSYRNVSDWMYTSFYTWGNFAVHDDFLGNDKNGVSELKLEFQTSSYGGLFSSYLLYQNYKNQNALETFDFNSSVNRENSALFTSVTFKAPLKNSTFWVESDLVYSFHAGSSVNHNLRFILGLSAIF